VRQARVVAAAVTNAVHALELLTLDAAAAVEEEGLVGSDAGLDLLRQLGELAVDLLQVGGGELHVLLGAQDGSAGGGAGLLLHHSAAVAQALNGGPAAQLGALGSSQAVARGQQHARVQRVLAVVVALARLGLLGLGLAALVRAQAAAAALGYNELPPELPADAHDSDEILRKIHHALNNIDIIEGELICRESGRVFPIKNGIPNMLLREDEV